MKWLKKYKLFESYNRFGTKTLTELEFDQIRKENCKNWTKVETPLYRGMPDLGDYLYIDPLKGDLRTSIEDTNIHLDLMSNLPSWKEYPKYERCVIGGSPGAVGTYGDAIYEVIPFDGVKIAVCPYATIWETFGDKLNGWGDYIYLVDGFLYVYPIVSAPGKTLEDRLKSLGKIVEIPHMNEYPGVDEFLKHLSSDTSYKLNKSKEEITGEDCFNYINDYLFNPVERGIKLMTYDQNFKIENRKQFWTEGPCLLIKGKLA